MGIDPTKAGHPTSSKRSSNTPDGPLTNQDSAHDVDLLREHASREEAQQAIDDSREAYEAETAILKQTSVAALNSSTSGKADSINHAT